MLGTRHWACHSPMGVLSLESDGEEGVSLELDDCLQISAWMLVTGEIQPL